MPLHRDARRPCSHVCPHCGETWRHTVPVVKGCDRPWLAACDREPCLAARGPLVPPPEGRKP